MVKVEQYFGFGAADYEAVGGFGDLIIKSDSLEKVVVTLNKHKKDNGGYFNEYWVIDMETFKNIASTQLD